MVASCPRNKILLFLNVIENNYLFFYLIYNPILHKTFGSSIKWWVKTDINIASGSFIPVEMSQISLWDILSTIVCYSCRLNIFAKKK